MTLSTGHAFAELGLAPNASEPEVKAAWRRLVSQWHPDRNGNADAVERMQRINQAYRAIRRSGFGGEPASAPNDEPHPEAAPNEAPDPASHHHEDQHDDEPRRTIARKIRLTLEEAAAGCTRLLAGKLTDDCMSCTGRGYRVPGGPCAHCDGAGALRQRAWFGWLGTTQTSCEACEGSGIARQHCAACEGSGKAPSRSYKFKVRIPRGAHHGDLLHVDGGHTLRGQRPVDLELRVEIVEHPLFKLDEDGTIRIQIPVDGFAWIANRSIKVPTLTGMQSLPLSRDRTSYRLAGQGFPAQRRGPPGDQLIELVPIFPDQLSIDQEILIDQLMATGADPEGQGADERINTWNRAVRAWESSLPSR